MQNPTIEQRIKALAAFLGVNVEDLEVSSYDETIIESGAEEYKVLTDEEAYQATREYIEESLWAFKASFIASHCKTVLSDKSIKAIAKMQEELCEDANEIVKALIEDMDRFVDDAIDTDGRGQFLSSYDSEEYERDNFFIYRQN